MLVNLKWTKKNSDRSETILHAGYYVATSNSPDTFENCSMFKSFDKSWMLRNINWKNHEKIVESNSEQGHPIL